MLTMPQAELETEHFFSGGMYCRKVFRKAGTLIVGKVHKKAHFFICCQGEIMAWTESGMLTLKPGDVVESQPGTNKRNLNKIEKELLEPDEMSAFDSANKLLPQFQKALQ